MSEAEFDERIAVALRGAPSWITADFVRETMRVWQPRAGQELTVADAVEIIMNASRLLDVLLDSPPVEASRSVLRPVPKHPRQPKGA